MPGRRVGDELCVPTPPYQTPLQGPLPQRVVRALLFIGFAFAVMADPVSSVAYTIEASLRALNGHLGVLMATQIIVLAIIALVDVNYWQLVGRFPLGGDRRRRPRGRSAPAGCSCRSAR